MNNILTTIANETLDLETLETRRSGALDFHEHAVWEIKAALERAYEAGRQASPPTKVPCPACGREVTIQAVS